jgi:hypothetical protein
MRKRSEIIARASLRKGLCGAVLSLMPVFLCGQEGPPIPDAPSGVPINPSGPPVTVRGVVLNAASGEPLARALVKTDSPLLGALTNGEGRFEIAGVPSGAETFWVIKPGFQEPGEADDAPAAASHAVTVAADMPEITFRLAPSNAVIGHVTLSSDSPAVGFGVTLLRKTVNEGRAGWTRASTHQTTPSGAVRFSGLRDGTYLLLTEPEFENGNDVGLTCNADGPADTSGYAARFYNDTQELASAARIQVAGGQNAEVTLALNVTQLHLVTAGALRAPAGADWSFVYELYDQNGHALEYPLREMQDHSLCVYVPDGSYTLMMEATKQDVDPAPGGGRPGPGPIPLSGLVQFSVDGHAVRRLHIPLAEDEGTPVHIRFEPGPPKPVAMPQIQSSGAVDEMVPSDQALNLSAERANSMGPQGQGASEADRINEDTYVLRATAPGAYWIEATTGQPGTCLGTATSAGQNLAETPWSVDMNGVGAPIDVVVRTDCGKLTVELPPASPSPGEDQPIFVYAVPEFNAMEGMLQAEPAEPQLGMQTVELQSLAPGTYRVYAFHSQRSIEYRDLAALELLGQGQEVTVEPNGNATMTIRAVNE